MKEAIRVLHIIGSLGYGGAEQLVINLCNAIDPACFHLAVCSMSDVIPLADRLIDRSMMLATCGCTESRPTIASFYHLARAVRSQVRSFEPHIIHSHLFSLNAPLQWFGSLRSDCRNVITIHTDGMHYTDRGLRANALRSVERCNARATRADVIAVSTSVAGMVQSRLRVPRHRIHTIQNGIDVQFYSTDHHITPIRAELGIAENDCVVTSVARLFPQKDHRTLLQAWVRVQSEASRTKLVLVGDGTERLALEQLADELHVQDSVLFLGRRDDVPALLAASDIGVFSSRHEGLSLAAIEMMSMRLPVVATDIPSFRELLIPGAGRLAPVGDAERLSHAILSYVLNPAQRARDGICARERAKALYSLEIQAKSHESLYHWLMH